ncbi:hypothetical protein [Streptomyces sp. NBC_01443]|uniref:hypothetical protein n=1 Tax=Streptomyces sp. NBC_01443 TaxID=2903868 RepID=UPI00225A57DC|nr:hypothetical protein [Streptomyces sp. NBC_01443]MCX4632910.1 hypothetical protein [Streptomyces sp. NBC_01443]
MQVIATDLLTEAVTGKMIPAPCRCGVSVRHANINLCATCIRGELTARGESDVPEAPAEIAEPVPAAPSRKKGGRPPEFSAEQLAAFIARLDAGETAALCRETGVGASTTSTALKRAREAAHRDVRLQPLHPAHPWPGSLAA